MNTGFRLGKPKGKDHLEDHRCRWEDNIKIDHKEIGWEGVEWIHLAQDRNHCRLT
jgi:hypothetical protein